MNWSDITSGYMPQGSQYLGGLLGGPAMQNPGMFAPQFSALFRGFGQSPFPQYGGNTRSAQTINNYMGGLLSRRQGYQPPAMPNRFAAAPAAAPTAMGYGGQPIPDYATESRG
jgi:hypothetical protein